jgi:hypothetical protein
MCGYTCRSGGRYIPGPPDVCYARGMEYCGSSGDRIGIEVPGVGGFSVEGPRRERRESNCRTVTIEDDYGNIRRHRRCD